MTAPRRPHPLGESLGVVLRRLGAATVVLCFGSPGSAAVRDVKALTDGKLEPAEAERVRLFLDEVARRLADRR